MARINIHGIDWTKNATGFKIGGGTTRRYLTIAGSADMIMTGSGTNVHTFPNATTTLVGIDVAQTLTNKTINGASNTITILGASQISGQVPVANGGTGAASFTAGRVLVGNGTSAITTNSELFFDTSNIRLGIRNPSPSVTLELGRSQASGGGTIVGEISLNRQDGSGSRRRFKVGLNANYGLSMGDYSFEGTTTYTEHFELAWNGGALTIRGAIRSNSGFNVNGTAGATNSRNVYSDDGNFYPLTTVGGMVSVW